MTGPQDAQTIVFFDGVCHLCNAFVDFVVQRDGKGRLRFAPLQGQTAARLLSPEDRKNLETVMVWSDSGILKRSEAVLQVLRELPFPWPFLASVGKWLPRIGRDKIYDFIAKNRYRWFGQRETCRLPTPEERSRILD